MSDDLRILIREEIRRAFADVLRTGSDGSHQMAITGHYGGFPLVQHDGGEMLAINAAGEVTWPERLRSAGARLCVHQTFGHSYDPIRPDGRLTYDGPSCGDAPEHA